MYSFENSPTYTPPPAAAKPAPYELVFVSLTVHPEALFALMEQFEYVRFPDMVFEVEARHLVTISLIIF